MAFSASDVSRLRGQKTSGTAPANNSDSNTTNRITQLRQQKYNATHPAPIDPMTQYVPKPPVDFSTSNIQNAPQKPYTFTSPTQLQAPNVLKQLPVQQDNSAQSPKNQTLMKTLKLSPAVNISDVGKDENSSKLSVLEQQINELPDNIKNGVVDNNPLTPKGSMLAQLNSLKSNKLLIPQKMASEIDSLDQQYQTTYNQLHPQHPRRCPRARRGHTLAVSYESCLP